MQKRNSSGPCLGSVAPLLALAAIIGFSAVAVAQSDRGTITGTVSDPAGAVIPNAIIGLRSRSTAAQYQSVTTATGNYTVPALPAGRYSLTVTAPGFNQYVQEGIDVQVAMTARVDVVLKIGSTNETVTVEANAQLLRTESAEQSQTINGDVVNELPLTLGGNNLYGTRNPLAGLTLAPGTSQTLGTNFFFRANGSTNTARYLLDGQDITTLGMTSSHLSESHPSTEALQETTLQTSNFAAEFGQVQGGLVNFTTRSGTNSLHGGAYDYFMNEALNAGKPFTDDGSGHLVRQRQRNNNYGFTLGGPVYLPKLYDGRGKTFFFFNFDQFRNRATVKGGATTVPTAAFRQGDFRGALTGRVLGTDVTGRSLVENMIFDPASDFVLNGQTVRLPFTNNTIPLSQQDPVALKIQAMMPNPANSQLVNNLPIVDNTASTTTLPSIKIDQLAGTKTKLSFYWGSWNNTVPKSTGDGLPFPMSNAREFVTHTNTFRLNVDQTVTPTLLIHVAGGEIRYWHLDSNPAVTREFDAPGKLGLVGGLGNPTGFPAITGLSGSQGGYGSNFGWTNGVRDMDDKPTFVASATNIRGNHTFKVGMEWWKDIWSFISYNTAGNYGFSAAQTALPYLQTTTVGGANIGYPYASFLLGAVNTESIKNQSDPQVRKWGLGIYLQDTWKVTRKLTLDYGLRWDRQTGWHELHSRSASFAPWLANPAVGGVLGATAYEGDGAGRCNCSFTNTYNFAFGPRLGVAYQIDSKTVVRAGWGLVYGQTPPMNYQVTATVGVGFNTLSFSNTAFGLPYAYLKDGLRYDPAKLYDASLDPGIRPQPGTINSPPSWLDDTGGHPPRINQWNISVQREILPNLLVEGAYVGNRAAGIQAGNAVNLNGLSPEMMSQRGFDITNAADRTVLTSLWNSAAAQARGFRAPYAGYPTGLTVAQALRPYPQFGNIGTMWNMRGKSWYDALQAKVTKRYSHNLQVAASFTWQKELEYGRSTANNVYNNAVNKTISSESQPFVLAIGPTYRTPGVGSNRVVKNVVRDWTFGGYLRYASGLPIQAPAGQNNLSLLLFQNTFMNRVPDQPLYLKDLNCHCIDPNKDFVLNPGAWSNPAAGNFGTAAAYYNDYRFQRHPSEQIGVGRLFQLREGMSVEVRAEFFNFMNRAQMADPSSGNALATQGRNAQGVPISGFGYINSQAPATRQCSTTAPTSVEISGKGSFC